MARIVIDNQMATLNDYIKAERTNRFIAAKLKKTNTELAAYYAKGTKPISGLCDYTFTWVVKNKRVDPDNIYFACKFVLDGLVMAGVIPDDSQKFVRSICHFHEIGQPKVIIDIEEA